MFDPPRCPNRRCPRHREPGGRFFRRHGHYRAHCRHYPVPRFRCLSCNRTFSRQTFRADFGQRKPYLNATFLSLMVSCVGQRQAARVLRVARRTIEHRFDWLASHARDFHLNRLRHRFLEGPFQLDELESFESNRYQPVTVPILIHRKTYFLVATSVAPLRRKGRLTERQRIRRLLWESMHGRRPSSSSHAVHTVMEALRRVTRRASPVSLESDYKPAYGHVGRAVFGRYFRWRRHSADARRDRSNGLFPINHTNARLRHFLSRLRRRTWCVSRRRSCLKGHLDIATLWSNYCRGITNRTRTTPAEALGLVPRIYRPEEVLGWREDWGALSPAFS